MYQRTTFLVKISVMKISIGISTLVSTSFLLYDSVLHKSKFQNNQYRRSDIVLEGNSFKNRFREFTDRSQMPSYNQICNLILYFVIQVTFLPFIFWKIQTFFKKKASPIYFFQIQTLLPTRCVSPMVKAFQKFEFCGTYFGLYIWHGSCCTFG